MLCKAPLPCSIVLCHIYYFWGVLVDVMSTDDEQNRLRTLKSYGVLDTVPEKDFDDIVRLASMICSTPVSLISLIDSGRQWFKARVGLDVEETPREIAFCAHAIHDDEIFEVKDAAKDPRFEGNPLVTSGPTIRFYAGKPLVASEGSRIGTLCVIDTVPRELTDEQRFALEVLARQVVTQMELRRMNKRIRETAFSLVEDNEGLERKHKITSNMLSAVSHDVRSPLASLRMFVELIRDKTLSLDEIQKIAGDIDTLVGNTALLLNNALRWAKSQIDGRAVHKEPVRVEAVALGIIEELHSTASRKGISIEFVPPGYTVLFEMEALQFVLRNLCHNAVKFSHGGTVEISCRAVGGMVDISVKDQGVGMPPEQVGHLFDLDRHPHRSGTVGETGSGVGLLLVREFVQKVGGAIRVDSVPEKGTTVTVRLPKAI